MAKGTDEFAGTAIGDTTDAIVGASIDPATIANNGGGSGGTGGGNGGSGTDDDFVRDADGNIKRNKDGTPRRKRGRKAGSGNSQSPRKTGADLKGSIDTLSRTLAMLHLGVAGVTKTPELELDTAEADMLANATVNVLREFDITPDPKTEAIFGLIIAASTVYGPRVYVIRKRWQEEASQRLHPVTNVDGNVIDAAFSSIAPG